MTERESTTTKTRSTVGRYSGVRKATTPGSLPREGRQGHQHVKHGAVDDPNPALHGKRQQVAVNVRTDAIENEYAYGRISESAYRAGRAYQRVLEMAGGKPSGGGQWMEGDRVDAAAAHEMAILRGIVNAEKAVAMIFDLLPVIGMHAANIMRMALIDRMTLQAIAMQIEGKSDRWSVGYCAETFRRALQQVADHWAKSTAPR